MYVDTVCIIVKLHYGADFLQAGDNWRSTVLNIGDNCGHKITVSNSTSCAPGDTCAPLLPRERLARRRADAT